MTTLLTFRRYVRQRLGVPQSDDFFTDVVLTDLVNLALASIEEEHYWPWSERMATGTFTPSSNVLVKPAQWKATKALFIGDTEVSQCSVTDLLAWGTRLGQPEQWADAGPNILVGPTPPAAGSVGYTHLYYVTPVALSLDADVPDLPEQFADALVCKAAELGSAREDDQSARQAHASDYVRWVQRMSRSVRRTTGPLKVRVRPGGWV